MTGPDQRPAEVAPDGLNRLGAWLVSARVAKGWSRGDLAERTRIPVRAIEALEGDDYAALPHATFTAGFLRSIARELGLSENEAIARYRADHPGGLVAPAPVMLAPIEPERVPSRRLAWASGIIAVALMAGAAIYLTRGRQPAPPTLADAGVLAAPAPNVSGAAAAERTAIPDPQAPAPARNSGPDAGAPPAPAATPGAGDSSGASPPAAAGAVAAAANASHDTGAAPAASGPPSGVTITATQDVWVQVRDAHTGERAFYGLLAQGQTFTVPQGDLRLKTGRAGALQLRVNGRLLPPLGGPGETVRDVDLAPSALIARLGASAGTAIGAPGAPSGTPG